MAKQNVGAFVPTTSVWDVSEIYSTDVTSEAFKELLVRLYQNINNISMSLNIKDSAYYDTEEFVCGQQFFPNPALSSASTTDPAMRQTFRQVVNFGVLPNTATKTAAHNIAVNAGYTFTRIYGVASNTTGLSYIPLPYSAATVTPAADNVELWVDGTNVNVKTGKDLTAYNVCYVVLEYLKQ